MSAQWEAADFDRCWLMCRDSGETAMSKGRGAFCPIHEGDECLREFVPLDEVRELVAALPLAHPEPPQEQQVGEER